LKYSIKYILTVYFLLSAFFCASAQTDSVLKEMIVSSFHSNLRWKDVPIAVSIISKKELSRFSSSSLVPAMNTQAGIRMEERSPGSYRLSVRGSLLRSPFGVRNVKLYWNEIPLSDATGNTYLNLLDINQINHVEVAKGPAASVYGAGTGGVFLLAKKMNFEDTSSNLFSIGNSIGSFGLNQVQAEWLHSSKNTVSSVQISRLQSTGYREQSALLRSGLVWQTVIKLNKQLFKTMFFYTDLFYETPGGITAAQMETNPTLSRQAIGNLPSAKQQKTAIYNKTLFAALHHETSWSDRLNVKSFVSIGKTKFANPFITNYERREETNINFGSKIIYTPFKSQPLIQWINGFEWLINESNIQNFINKAGKPDLLQNNDIVNSQQRFFFSQLKLEISPKLLVIAGFSNNQQLYDYKRISDPIPQFIQRKIGLPFVPRLSVLHKINQQVSLYGIIAQGFSPPGLAEVRPSDGNFYPFLNAEKGWNTEIGIKGILFANKLQFDLSFYQFNLKDAIVRRNDAVGAEYFINAGSTSQKGMETMLRYTPFLQKKGMIKSMQIWTSFSYQSYQFKNYKQGVVDFSGNAITGVPLTVFVAGIDAQFGKDFYVNASINATDRIPLNDANTVFANAYQLVQTKLGKLFKLGKNQLEVFFGADNLLNQVYSLGNDINAAGNRFFNPAPSRNVFGGFRFAFQ
jgi:iron complex outermembrane recepter protein